MTMVMMVIVTTGIQEVPEKSKSHVFLECARLEEFTGNLECARQILGRARGETKSEWKVRVTIVMTHHILSCLPSGNL